MNWYKKAQEDMFVGDVSLSLEDAFRELHQDQREKEIKAIADEAYNYGFLNLGVSKEFLDEPTLIALAEDYTGRSPLIQARPGVEVACIAKLGEILNNAADLMIDMINKREKQMRVYLSLIHDGSIKTGKDYEQAYRIYSGLLAFTGEEDLSWEQLFERVKNNLQKERAGSLSHPDFLQQVGQTDFGEPIFQVFAHDIDKTFTEHGFMLAHMEGFGNPINLPDKGDVYPAISMRFSDIDQDDPAARTTKIQGMIEQIQNVKHVKHVELLGKDLISVEVNGWFEE